MKKTAQITSFFFLGIFLFVILFQALHVIEHYNDEALVHTCKNHDHQHKSESSHDCPICDFTLNSFTESEFFAFNSLISKAFSDKINTEYVECLLTSEYQLFSLRAPPLV
ncbi:MAG: hypothetical protein AB7D46_04150 [Flavobacteriaceae bacterium]